MTPDVFFSYILEKIHWKENKQMCKRILGVTSLTCLFNYFYVIMYGYAGPDAICEGVYYYIGQNTATRLARWFIPFLTSFFGKNIVIPLVIILFYCGMIGFSAFLLCKIWKIESVGFQILTTSAMVCFPVIIRQFAYLYTALAYSFAFLMTVLALYFLKKNHVWSFILGAGCLVLMFGSFQSYIGAAAALILMNFLLDLNSHEKLSKAFQDLIKYIVAGIIAGIFDLAIANVMMNYRGIEASSRVSEVSVSEIIACLDFSLPVSYKWFFMYFESDILSRNKLYMVLFFIIFILIIWKAIVLLKHKNIFKSILLLVGTTLIPLAMNVCAVIFPHNGMYDVMRYQYVLLIPFLFALFSHVSFNLCNSFLQWISYGTIFSLIMGYTISANASAICYKLAYESTYTQAVSMLSEIYELEAYQAHETPIVLGGGTIGYADTYEAFGQLFRYAIVESGPVFWPGEYGLTTCRYYYFLDYLGINPGWLTNEQYRYVVNTEQYREMPCWPQNGSVQMIDGYAVIKISD